ncbi:MAG: hypothetical protein WA143_12275, partial [Lutibacter sp.]
MVKKLLNLKIRYYIFTLLFMGAISVFANTAATTNTSFSLLKSKAVVAVDNNTSNSYGENITLSDNLSFVNYLWADTPTAQAGFKKVFQKVEVLLFKEGVSESSKKNGLEGVLAATITCPPPITIECDESTDPANTGTATGTVGGGCLLVLTYSDSSTKTNNGSCTDYSYVITRTWTAAETSCGAGGAPASCTQTITITDSTAPTWTTVSGALNTSVSCSDSAGLSAAQAL